MSRTSRLLVCASGWLGLWVQGQPLPVPTNAVVPTIAQASAAPDNTGAGEAVEPAGEETTSPQAPPSPYGAIIVRNVFGLKPLPPQAPPPDPQAQVTPSALKLVCITTLLGKRACFVVQEPGKPQVNSDLLREGEKDSSITNLEVLQIDPRAGSVKVNYGNKQLTLDFKSNGIAPPVGPAIAAPGPMLAGRPGGPGGPLGGPPAPGLPPPGLGQASQPVAADSGRGLRPIPTRPTRLPLGEGTGYGFGATGGSGRYGYNTSAQAQNQPNLSAEQQVVIMKAQEQQAVRTGIPFPPTPGLDFQPGAQGAAQGQQAGPELPPVPGAPIPLPPTPGN